MRTTYQHTLRYSDLAGARPLFQNYLKLESADSNLNRSVKRYYSSTDVSLYFGDFFIDDATAVSFELTESAMLLYGYNSYVFDDVAKGSRMVQGQFSINFTAANYLSKVMSDLSQYKGTGLITHSSFHATWPVGFDLLIHHGSNQHSISASNDLQLIILKDIYITGCAIQYDTKTGAPVEELYTFVGRDVVFGAELEAEPTTPNTETMPDTSRAEIKTAYYNANDKQICVEFNRDIIVSKMTYRLEDETVFKRVAVSPTADYLFKITLKEGAEMHDWNEGVVLFLKVDFALKSNPEVTFKDETYHCVASY